MYIYHLPYEERRQLCYILDQQNKWEELGSLHMAFDPVDLEPAKKAAIRGSSPSEELLTMWGNFNHTVLELFVLLSRMKLNSAMKVLKGLIDNKYHYLIEEKEDNLAPLVRNLTLNDSRTPVANFNNKSEKILNNKVVINCTSRSDNNDENIGPAFLQAENFADRRLLKPNSPLLTRPYTASSISVVESTVSTPQIPYEELQKSTNNWDEKTVLGKGGFGKVYKGTWKCTKVAIKRLEVQAKDKNEQFKQTFKELYYLNCYRHDNILPLYGYSMEGQHPCLVYQYMSGGSLDTRLRATAPEKVLDWPTRLNIAIGTARGLQFLHTSLYGDKPLIHGDIKSANILLDPCDHPRIGDFGLAREGPQSHYTHIIVSKVYGTVPYLPPDFLRSQKLSTKVDTYSFGIVLFELATALRAFDKRDQCFLKEKVESWKGDILELKDEKAAGNDEFYRGLIEVGKWCVRCAAKDRPEMVSVLIALEGLRR